MPGNSVVAPTFAHPLAVTRQGAPDAGSGQVCTPRCSTDQLITAWISMFPATPLPVLLAQSIHDRNGCCFLQTLIYDLKLTVRMGGR